MGINRVVLDTNIYISAFLFGGEIEKIVDLAIKEKIKLLISEDILAEISKILKKKFGLNDQTVSKILDVIREISILITPNDTLKIIKDDSDNRILECAVEGDARYIVSGDKHLLALEEYKGIKILNAADFLNLFFQK